MIPLRQEFFDYMRKRHSIYLRKSAGEPPPWIDDKALQRLYLTNVYRELDTVTIWVRRHIREPYADHPNLWFMLLIARLLNWPDTLADVMSDKKAWPHTRFDGTGFLAALHRRKRRREKVFGNAYILTNGGEAIPKDEYTTTILDEAWQQREYIEPRLHDTMEIATNVLRTLSGIGGFIAYEVACDLRYTRYLENAPDVRTWAHAGPGAKRGLNWVHGIEPVEKSMPEKVAVERMRVLLEELDPQWPYEPRLEMREIEHSLCEFAKVCKFRYHGKRPKRWYPGEGE